MKTMTLFRAYERAQSLYIYGAFGNSNRSKARRERKGRQYRRFNAALLRRIEEGDRARELLSRLEWDGDETQDCCAWTMGKLHASDCPRLVLRGRQP